MNPPSIRRVPASRRPGPAAESAACRALRLPVLAFWLALVAVGSAGCADGDSTAPEFADLDGTWEGELTVTGGGSVPADSSFALTLVIEQTGVGFTGDYSAADGREGRLTGSVTSRDIEMQLLQEEPCRGNFGTMAVVSETETEMAGLASGSDCEGAVQAEFFARKR